MYKSQRYNEQEETAALRKINVRNHNVQYN